MGGSAIKRVVWLLAVLCSLAPAILGQHKNKKKTAVHDQRETPVKPVAEAVPSRLLTPDEGLAVIGAALETRQSTQSSGDCSHLVHVIYERAGFPYRYADSSELYAGIENFSQVPSPQAGDLAIWRGHAAIVVNPAQHSFFSATRKGLRVESYDLEYWKRRGTPRFFRYVKPASSSSTSHARTSAAMPAASRDSEPPQDSSPPPAREPFPSAPGAVTGLPRILVLHVRVPNPRQVTDALPMLFVETDKGLRGQDLMTFSQPLAVFDRIEVKAVHLKGNQGTADLKVEGVSTVINGLAAPKKRSEQQHWAITRRDAETWELLLPREKTYLPRDLAVRNLAHRLASLTDNSTERSGAAPDQAQLARMLNLLLEK